MSAERMNLDALLGQAEQGRLDELTPQQVAALELWLNRDPAAAERLAKVRPTVDPGLPPATLTAAERERLWSRIAAGAASHRAPAFRPTWRVWSSVATVAAAVALVVFLRLLLPGASPHLTPAVHGMQVNSLELESGALAYISPGDDNGGYPVIWVFEPGQGV
jgi:hypothetical protein